MVEYDKIETINGVIQWSNNCDEFILDFALLTCRVMPNASTCYSALKALIGIYAILLSDIHIRKKLFESKENNNIETKINANNSQ